MCTAKTDTAAPPSLVIAYYIRDKGMTYNEALEFVSSKRPEIHLWKTQQNRLKEFEQLIHTKGENDAG